MVTFGIENNIEELILELLLNGHIELSFVKNVTITKLLSHLITNTSRI